MIKYLWIEAMKAMLWQFEGVTSGAHNAPKQLCLPLNTAKCSQTAIHYMSLQNMIEFVRGPPFTRAGSPICLVRKAQCLLQILANPFCKFCGQPAQDRVSCAVNILQPVWRGSSSTRYQVWG